MQPKIIRFFNTEMRASDTDNMSVEGYALKFDTETIIGSPKWGWREKISRTALDNAKLDNVVFCFNHSFDSVLARTTNQSLKLLVDSVGLKISANIVDTSIGRDVFKLIKENLINRMSFAAVVKKSTWFSTEYDSEELDLREITEFDRFYDVSAVTFPAYEDTSIMARSDEMLLRRKQIYDRQIEKLNFILGGTKNV